MNEIQQAYSQQIPTALRQLRRRTSSTQHEVARRAGIHKNHISAYENGRRLPSLATLFRLIAALDADLLDLAAAMGMEGVRPETRARLLEAWGIAPTEAEEDNSEATRRLLHSATDSLIASLVRSLGEAQGVKDELLQPNSEAIPQEERSRVDR
ncbi:MAG: helix-turn-helix transcriptional regulator [Acidobacteriota bacterium]